MSPSCEFYENLKLSNEENNRLIESFADSQFPTEYHKFLTEIKTNKDLALFGLLNLSMISLGKGSLNIPLNLSLASTSEEEFKLKKLFSRNLSVLPAESTDLNFRNLDLEFGNTYGDAKTPTVASGSYFEITLIRSAFNYVDRWRDIEFPHTKEKYVPSAIGLAKYFEGIFGWQIKPLPYEETLKKYS